MVRAWLRYWYRRLTHRCVVCGGARNVHRVGPWIGPLAYACGWCNKRVQHGMNYGMSGHKLQALLKAPN